MDNDLMNRFFDDEKPLIDLWRIDLEKTNCKHVY